MSERAIIACGFAHEKRWLTGRVLKCADCRRKIYLTDDTREHVEREGEKWIAVCIPCATKRAKDDRDPNPELEITPLARAMGNAHGRRN